MMDVFIFIGWSILLSVPLAVSVLLFMIAYETYIDIHYDRR